MRSLTWKQVHARRLARGHLLERAPAGQLVEMVSDLCAVQAQVQTAAELAIAARVDGVTRSDLQDELWERRRLVKAWSLRGTLHLHAADELPLWQAMHRVKPYWRERSWLERYGLTRAEADAILEAIGDGLVGRRLTRRELGADVERRVGSWAKRQTGVIQFGGLASTWVQLLGAAASTGRLCHGPSQGAQTTFVRADEWLGGWLEHDPGRALAEAFRRYLRTYGPARPDDFAGWTAVERERARRLAKELGDEIVEVDVEGRRALLLAEDLDPPEHVPEPCVRLLPKYDLYLLGCRFGRERIVPAPVAARLREHPRGRYEGAVGHELLLVDGIVAGIWSRAARGKRLEVRAEPFRRLTAAERRLLVEEAARVGAFLGVEAALTVGRS